MAKWQFGTPGGYDVEVDAPDEAAGREIAREQWQTLPRLIARNGDTRVFEGTSGTRYLVSPGYSTSEPSRVQEALDGMSAGDISKKSIDEGLIEENLGAARAGEFARGSIFGSYVDEGLGKVWGDNAQLGARALSGAMQRQRPGETLGLNLAGGLTEAALTAGMAQAAAPARVAQAGQLLAGSGSRAARMGRGALSGAALGTAAGGFYGYGEGTTPEERREEAGTGAKYGAVFGTALGAASPIVSDIGSNLIGRVRRSDVSKIASELGVSQNAAKVIKNTFDEGGDMQAAYQNLVRAGDEAMLADAGEAAQALLDASAQSGGSAAEIAKGAVQGRMERTRRSLDEVMDSILGPSPEGPMTAVDEIAARTAPDRRAAYSAAYDTKINYASPEGRKIEEVLSRVAPDDMLPAIKEANAQMLASGLQNQQIMASIAPDGTVTYSNPPNVRQLDEIKKALQRIAQNNTDDFGRLNGVGQRYNDLARQLRDATGDAAEPYKAAVRVGGDNIAEQQAFVTGERLLRPSTYIESVTRDLGPQPSTAQVAAARSGLRMHMEKVIGDVRTIASDPGAMDAREVMRAVTEISSANAREKIRRLLGPDAVQLMAELDQALQSSKVRAAMAANSRTFGRAATDRTVGEITAPGVIGTALEGEPVMTTKRLIQAATGRTSEFSADQRQRIYSEIARALTERSGDDALMALRALDGAMSGQAMTEAQTNILAELISGVLATGGATALATGAASESRNSEGPR